MTQPTSTFDSAIAAFAAVVRRHLDDLSPEDVDDLTGGLEADLSEQATDDAERLSLDDPEGYADELRASAGLPARNEASPEVRPSLRQRATALRGSLGRTIRSSPFGAWLLDFALALRPVWWVYRGWAAYQLFAFLVLGRSAVLPQDPVMWVLVISAVMLSTQWGRGRWAPVPFMRGLRSTVSVVAIVLTPFLFGWTLHMSGVGANGNTAESVVSTDPNGLWLDGERVQNIFGYDADGNPISNLQLFDQDGRPLVTVGTSWLEEDYDTWADGTTITVPFDLGTRGTAWNIFPLAQTERDATGDIDTSDAHPATPPFRTTYPVPGASTPTPVPTPTPPPADTPQ